MSKKVYVNPKQKTFLRQIFAAISIFLGTRASGKTGALAYRMYQRISLMPRGKFFVGALTIEQLKNVILPNVFKLLKEFYGLIEGEDYVLYKKPPSFFKEPIEKPEEHVNVIYWSNGSWTQLVSYKKRFSYLGSSFDGGDFDEGLLWTWAAISRIFKPTMRGNKNWFGKCPLHHNISIFSSLPRTPEGMWLMSMEEKAKADPETYYYLFATWKDNIPILGANWGEEQKKVLLPIDYQIEVEGKHNIKTGEEYYWAFDYKKHTYQVSKGKMTYNGMIEYNAFAPFDLVFDFASHFNCMWIVQRDGLERRCIDAMHVYFEDKLNVLISNFCNHPRYSQHENKHVNLWGEPHGMKQREDNQPLFIQVKEQFQKHGWTCSIFVDKYDKAALHKSRYVDMNDVFAEHPSKPHYPFFRMNRDTCEDAIIAMQRTKVKPDFKKNKNEEKHPRLYNQAHAPHYGDGLDNYRRQLDGTGNAPNNQGAGAAGIT